MPVQSASRVSSKQPGLRARRTGWKTHAFRLVAVTSSLAVALLLGEVAVRYFCPHITPPLTVKDGELGMRYLRSFEGLVYDTEAGREVPLRFNRHGFRGPDRPLEKPPGVKRIAVLGDSMIAAISVDEEDTLVGRLEAMLNSSDSTNRWEVMNFGVAGSSPGQALVLYEELVAKFQPDIVLCAFFVGNDLADNCHRLSMNPRIYLDVNEQGELYRLPFSESRAILSAWLNHSSRFYVWQKVQTIKLRERIRAATEVLAPGQLIYCRDEPEDVRHAWKVTEAVFRRFGEVVESAGSTFAVIAIPSCEQVCDDFFQEVAQGSPELASDLDPLYPNERLRDVCRRSGADLLLMLDEFREVTPSHSADVREEWVFHNGIGHFNERGNRIAAQAVHRFLAERILDDMHYEIAARP